MWERTSMLNDNNFFGNTFVANDGFGHGYSIVIESGKGVIQHIYITIYTYYYLLLPFFIKNVENLY